VYPREVAAELLALPEVLQAEVVGAPAGNGGTRLVAFVVLGTGAPQADELRRLLATRLPAYMIPAAVLRKDVLPRTASGKPDYPALVTEATASVGAVAQQSP
jgi:acyl-CoA synthetase (AMP-forming)/AMP-acid ligase II